MLIDVVRAIAENRATFGTSGNASERIHRNAFRITPSGVPWEDLSAAMLVEMSVHSDEALSTSTRPSTEWRAHRALYRDHSWVGGVVHLHSQYATILSTVGRSVRAVHYQMARVADEVPVIPYQTFGTQDLADAVAGAITRHRHAVLAANHGLFAVGPSADEALRAANEVEWTAMIQYYGMLIESPRVLSPQQLEAVREAFDDYGQSDGPRS